MKTLMTAVVLTMALGAVAEEKVVAQPAPEPAKASEEAKTDEIDLGSAASAEGVKLKMSGKAGDENALIDIDCDDATLADVLRQFRHAVGANIISTDSSNLQQRVSVSLHQVPWLESLQSILNTRHFRLEPRGGIYFVSEENTTIPKFTRTYTLNHASAEELAEMFNKNYGVRGKDGKVQGPVASSFVGANVIVVTADEKTLSECEAIIKAVDKAIAQIYIEARFIEASTEAMHRLGMQWDSLQSWGVSAHGITAGVEVNDGKLGRYANGTTTAYYTPKDSDGRSAVDYETKNYLSPSAIGDAIGAGRSAASMGWRNASGFSGQLSADDFRLALSAFESMADVKVFSNPKIIVSNGKEAKVDMTTKFPNVRVQATRSNTGGGSSEFDISTQLEVIPGEDKMMFAKEAFYSWGITLSVKPRISPDGLINVEIIPQISQLDTSCPNTDNGFYAVSGGVEGSVYSSFPVIGVKRLTTDFTMKDGSTAVIGGLSRTSEEDVDSGIPYLRKIPWVGPKIFGWKSRDKVQKEVIVFVTVGIANPADLPADAGLPKNAVLGRQYVDGTKLEPGDRKNAAEKMLRADTRAVDDPERNERAADL